MSDKIMDYTQKKRVPKQYPLGTIATNSAPFLEGYSFYFLILYKIYLTWLLRKKTAPLLKSGAVFQNSSRLEPFWLHFFFQCITLFRKHFIFVILTTHGMDSATAQAIPITITFWYLEL